MLLTCKAYDLDSAIAAIRPAMGPDTAVLPVLNGLAHIATLQREFGAEHVLGGIAKIQATLTPDGTVKQLNDWRWLTFGEVDGRSPPASKPWPRSPAGPRAWSPRRCPTSCSGCGRSWCISAPAPSAPC